MLADDLRHPVLKEDLRAFRPRALLQRPDQARAHPGYMVRNTLAGDRPLHGSPLSPHRRRGLRTRGLVLKLNSIFDQELEGVGVLVGEGPHQVPVAVAAVPVVVAHPVLIDLVRRILDPEFPLSTVTAAEVYVTPAHQSMAAESSQPKACHVVRKLPR